MSLLDSLLGGYVFAQQNGAPSAVPSRRTLIFAGATVIDDGPTANSTTILISGGGGSFPGGDLCSGTGTSVAVGSGLVLASGTLTAPSPFVHASTELLNGAGGAVTVGSGLSLAAGTITATGGGGGASVGAFAARPAVGTTGQVYIPTDQGGAAVYDGSAWRPMIGQYLCKRVNLASLTQVNLLGVATLSQWGDAVLADFGSYSSGLNLHGLVTSATSSVVVSARQITTGSINSVGAVLRESSTQKAAAFTMYIYSGSFRMTYAIFANDTNRGTYTDFDMSSIMSNAGSPFLKVATSGTAADYFVGYSPNGPWIKIASIAGAWSIGPDQGGAILIPYTGGAQMLIEHLETA